MQIPYRWVIEKILSIVLFSDDRSLRFCATTSVVALFFMEEKQNERTIGIILQGFLSTNENYNKKIRRKIIMYRKEKSSWKPPFGLTVFVAVITLTALLSVFALLRIGEDYISWGDTNLRLTYIGNATYNYYNYTPIVIAFFASFLPLLTFPIGKRMRGHQRLLAFTLFLVTVMIFFTCQGFRMKKLYSSSSYLEDFITIAYSWKLPLFTQPRINICTYTLATCSEFSNSAYLLIFIKYLLCFLPLLAFPITNAIHKKNQSIKTVTLIILLLIFTCWAVNLYFVSFDSSVIYWGNFKMFNKTGVDIGFFYFLGITLASVLPLLGLGVGKAPKKVEKHYVETKIIYFSTIEI